MTRTKEDEVPNNVVFEEELASFLDSAEELGAVGDGELEALAFERGLDDDELAAVRAELAAREVEIVPADQRDEEHVGRSGGADSGVRCASRPTRSRCS